VALERADASFFALPDAMHETLAVGREVRKGQRDLLEENAALRIEVRTLQAKIDALSGPAARWSAGWAWCSASWRQCSRHWSGGKQAGNGLRFTSARRCESQSQRTVLVRQKFSFLTFVPSTLRFAINPPLVSAKPMTGARAVDVSMLPSAPADATVTAASTPAVHPSLD